MNQIIKQRIEQINNGEIPDGYKKTQFGIFPCDWETKTLDQLLDFKNGVNADKEKYNSGVKMISVMDILSDTPIYYDSIKGQVDIDEETLKNYNVTYGDIVFQRSSETFEDAGKSNVYLDKDKIATYSGFVIRGKKKAEYDPYFLSETLRIQQTRNQIIRNAAGSQHINVGQDSLAKVEIPFANAVEQSKISEILMKWDEAINMQNQYVEKLETCRYAMIQRLLKPQIGWSSKRLNDILFEKCERVAERIIEPVAVGVFGIRKRSEIFDKELADDYSQNKVLRKDQICFGIGTNSIVYDVLLSNDVFCVSPAYKVCNIKSANPYFLKLVLDINNKYLSRKYMIISARQGKSVDFDGLFNEILLFPSIEIQDRIARMIQKVDYEISLHNQKIEKLKLQCKALQQYLLTGIVRV